MKVLLANCVFNLERAKWLHFNEKEQTLYAYESWDGTVKDSECPILTGEKAVRVWEAWKQKVDIDFDREWEEKRAADSQEPNKLDEWLAKHDRGPAVSLDQDNARKSSP